MNAIQQISLKIRLGIDTAAPVQPEELLEKWQAFNEQKNGSRLRAQYIGRIPEGLPSNTQHKFGGR